jgi:hypothetical protein
MIAGWTRRIPSDVAALVALLVLVGAVLIAVGWDLTFMRSDWDFLLNRHGSFADVVLAPHHENLVVGTSLVYRAAVHLVGFDPLGLRALLTLSLLAVVALLFVYLRARVGGALALCGAALVALMGSAYQALFWPVQIGLIGSLALGLGALLALERGTRRGDALACALLLASTVVFSLGVAFAVGAGVAIVVGGRARYRAWVAAVPLVLALVWWVIWGSDGPSAVDLESVASAPLFMYDAIAASIAGLLGLSTPQVSLPVDGLDWGRALLGVALVGAAVRLWRMRPIPPSLVATAATAIAFWLLTGAHEGPGRLAESSHLQFPGAVFVLMIAADLARGMTIGRRAVIVLSAVTAVAVVSSSYFLGHARDRYLRNGNRERAGLAALEIARATVSPGFVLDRETIGTGYAHLRAGPYLLAVDRFGHSPGFSESELAEAPPYARVAADRALAAALPIRLRSRGPHAGDCGVVVNRGDDPIAVTAGRFSGGNPVEVGQVAPGEESVVEIPDDASSRPWHVEANGEAVPVECARR